MTFLQNAVILFASEPGVWRADWAWGIPLIVFTLVLHVLGMGFAHQTAVGFFARQKDHRRPMVVFVVVISAMTVWATSLHAGETALWAVFYQLLGARPDYASAMLYSMGAITTYGHSGLYLEQSWQLMGAIEALNGWLLFGVTTAFLFSLIQKCREIAGR